MSRVLICILLAAVLTVAVPAFAATTKNGVTLVSPKNGAKVAMGNSVTFKAKAKGGGTVWVNVCASKRKNRQGVICNRGFIAQMKKSGSTYKATATQYNEFMLKARTYYWQVHRIRAEGNANDVLQEGVIYKITVTE